MSLKMAKVKLSQLFHSNSNSSQATTTNSSLDTPEKKKEKRRSFAGFGSSTKSALKEDDATKTADGQNPKTTLPATAEENTPATTNAVAMNGSAKASAASSEPDMIALAKKITAETEKVEKYMKEHKLSMPGFGIDAPADFPKLPDEIQQSRREILYATKSLRDLVTGPRESMRWNIWQYLDVSAMAIIINFNLAKLWPVGETITLAELGKRTPLDPVNLARTMRLAMTDHIFAEPSPGVIAHTAASRLLAEDEELVAWLGFCSEDIFPASANALKAVTTFPEATQLTQSGFQFAFDTVDKEPMFVTFGKDMRRAKRMGRAMVSLTGGEGYEVSYLVDTEKGGYDFSSIDAAGGTFVDVGGSHGFVDVDLARKYPHMKFVVQDLPKTVNSAPRTGEKEIDDRIEFIAHDFFTPQPTKDADVYFFRWIMHNYSTPYAVKILKNLLPALKPGARVIINDHCLREAGLENPWDEKIMRRMDMTMLALLNAQERTEQEFRDLFQEVSPNFVFKGVIRPKDCRMSIIEAIYQPGETVAPALAPAAETTDATATQAPIASAPAAEVAARTTTAA